MGMTMTMFVLNGRMYLLRVGSDKTINRHCENNTYPLTGSSINHSSKKLPLPQCDFRNIGASVDIENIDCVAVYGIRCFGFHGVYFATAYMVFLNTIVSMKFL